MNQENLKIEVQNIFHSNSGDLRHEALRKFVHGNPDIGLGYLYLGISYLVTRYSPILEWPNIVITLGSCQPAITDEKTQDHIDKAEFNLEKSKELNPALYEIASLYLAYAIKNRSVYKLLA